jgi:hypothetical protein
MTDDEFLRAFFRGWPDEIKFGHYEHVRLAWLVIDRHGPELAADIVGEGIRRMAIAQGKAALQRDDHALLGAPDRARPPGESAAGQRR